MKTLLALSLALFALPLAHAEEESLCKANGKDISSDLAAIVDAVAAQPSCWQAATLAGNCGWGSSADVQIAGTAAKKCGAELQANKPSRQERALLTSMFNACNAKWANREGTLYQSINAFCQLRAVEWMVNLTGDNG